MIPAINQIPTIIFVVFGNIQLFPEYRNGKKGHYPFIKPTGADSYPMPADTSFILGSRRNLVQYADIRYPSQPDSRFHAIQSVQAIQT